MGKDVYLDAAGRWITLLRQRRPDLRVRDLRASKVGRAELVAALLRGPQLVVYLGHGRARGWSGYQGVRWHHLDTSAPIQPVGVVIALACDTLAPGRDGIGFGERWVRSGRASAYVGAAGSIDIADGLALSARLVERLASGRDSDIGALLAAIADNGQSSRALARLRLVGDPRARLASAPLQP